MAAFRIQVFLDQPVECLVLEAVQVRMPSQCPLGQRLSADEVLVEFGPQIWFAREYFALMVKSQVQFVLQIGQRSLRVLLIG